MNRKSFMKTGILTGFGLAFTPGLFLSKAQQNKSPFKIEIIKEFVQAGHNNLDRIKEMLSDYPNLLFCRYDWGGGDFEEAIEGAGHLGNKDIANYLISKGARVNLFVLTMLGKTELVKPVLEQYNNLIFAKGPHGFSLLHHAIKGGNEAEELKEYLFSKGLKESKFNI